MLDSIKNKKVATLFLAASGEFTSLSVTFEEVGSLFEAIGELTNSPVVRNIASVGAFLANSRKDDCDQLESEYSLIDGELKTTMQASALAAEGKGVA